MNNINKNDILVMFGYEPGLKLYDFIYNSNIDNCQTIKNCIGISNSGSANLFLNQQGQFVVGGGDTLVSEGALINSATDKATPVDADMIGLMDSASSNILKKLSWLNLKATLETYFNTLYVGSGSIANKVDKVTGKSLIDDTEISRLASMTAIFTTALKTSYDSAVSWISTNGANLINHLSNTSNPHSVTKSQVGLSNVDNTSDSSKPISTAQQTALNTNATNISNNATAIGLKEDVSNKSTSVTTDQASNTKYPSVKSVFDWVISLGYITSSALSGYATQSWVNSQGFITNVITSLGYTPENVANKQTDLTASATKYPTVNAVNTGLATKKNNFSENTAFNKSFGSTSGTVTEGDDSRLSNSRTPTSHASTHTNGTDDIQSATISQKGLLTSTDWNTFNKKVNSYKTEIVTTRHYAGDMGQAASSNYAIGSQGGSGMSGVVLAGSTYTNAVGVIRLNSGTSNGLGIAIISPGSTNAYWKPSLCSAFYLARLNVSALSNATNKYGLRAGKSIHSYTQDTTDGIYFRYTHDVNSGKWQCVSRNASAETAINTSITPTLSASGWDTLSWLSNSAGTSVEFWINGASQGSITTNIPTSLLVDNTVLTRLSAGGASVIADVDLHVEILTYTI